MQTDSITETPSTRSKSQQVAGRFPSVATVRDLCIAEAAVVPFSEVPVIFTSSSNRLRLLLNDDSMVRICSFLDVSPAFPTSAASTGRPPPTVASDYNQSATPFAAASDRSRVPPFASVYSSRPHESKNSGAQVHIGLRFPLCSSMAEDDDEEDRSSLQSQGFCNLGEGGDGGTTVVASLSTETMKGEVMQALRPKLKQASLLYLEGFIDGCCLHRALIYCFRSRLVAVRTGQCFLLNGFLFLGSIFILKSVLIPTLQWILPDECPPTAFMCFRISMATEGGVKLLGFWTSAFVWRVKWALNLKGIEDYEYMEQDLSNKSPLLLQYNPMHKKVPVFIHNGKPLAESLVILEYIDETWKNHPLLPQDPYERAKARFWAKFADEKCVPPMIQTYLKQGEEQRKSTAEARESLKTLESGLEGRRFFGGDTIGFVDVAGGWMGIWARLIEEIVGIKVVDKEAVPLLAKWFDDVVEIYSLRFS